MCNDVSRGLHRCWQEKAVRQLKFCKMKKSEGNRARNFLSVIAFFKKDIRRDYFKLIDK